MAVIVSNPEIKVSCTFTVSEQEMRALDALAGYGDEAFIKTFYEKMGTAYLKPHEQGLREFLKSIRSVVAPSINQIDNVRKFINKGE